MIPEQIARTVSRAIGAGLFCQHSYDAKHNAQRNLSGKTHYAEDDTLRFFHARITSARAECSGLVFVLVESVAADHRNTSRGFRFVAFDLFGTVLSDRQTLSPETLLKSSDKARAAAGEWLSGFDVIQHYRDAMAERAARLEREAGDLRACAATLPAPVTA